MTRSWHIYIAGLFAPGASAQPLPAIDFKVTTAGRCYASVFEGSLSELRDGRGQLIPTGRGLIHLDLSSGRFARDLRSHIQATYLPGSSVPETAAVRMEDEDAGPNHRVGGAQAVMRAVDILVAVADGPISLPDLIDKTGLSKPTCHRIASALVERGLLLNTGRSGYRLGPMVKELARRSGC